MYNFFFFFKKTAKFQISVVEVDYVVYLIFFDGLSSLGIWISGFLSASILSLRNSIVSDYHGLCQLNI